MISPKEILKIGVFNDEEWSSLLDIVKELIKSPKIEVIKTNIINDFQERFHRKPTNEELSYLIEKFIENEDKKNIKST